MKTCTKCRIQKPTTEYYTDKKLKDGFASHCKNCHNVSVRKWRKENKEKCQTNWLKFRYGIDLATKQQLLSAQNNNCAICKTKLDNGHRTHVDHCHVSGKVRGILCGHCNHMLGHAKDNIETLKKAVQYLLTHK